MATPILFYDGYCVMCNFAVRWVGRVDRAEKIHFAPLDSPLAKDHIGEVTRDAIYFLEEGRVYSGFAALVRVSQYTSGLHRIFRVLKWIPGTLGEKGYDFVARHRTRWFGRLDHCPVPDESIRRRFLTSRNF